MTDASLRRLIAWYRDEVDGDIPQRIHSRDIDGGGSPEWHAAFRAWLTAHPAAETQDGQLRSPLKFWMWRLGGRRQRFLYVLAASDFDWRHAGRLCLVLNDDAAHDFARESLGRLQRLMYTDGAPNVPRRAERRACEVVGCNVMTNKRACKDHHVVLGSEP